MSQAVRRAPCYAPLIPAKAGIQLWVRFRGDERNLSQL